MFHTMHTKNAPLLWLFDWKTKQLHSFICMYKWHVFTDFGMKINWLYLGLSVFVRYEKLKYSLFPGLNNLQSNYLLSGLRLFPALYEGFISIPKLTLTKWKEDEHQKNCNSR